MLCAGTLPAHAAKIRVVTTLTDLADFSREVGGDLVEVHSLATGVEDTHGVPMKPSFVPMLNRADLLVLVGFDCEHAFLPALAGSQQESPHPIWTIPDTWIAPRASSPWMCRSPPIIPRATCIPTAIRTTCSIRCWRRPRSRTSTRRWSHSRRSIKADFTRNRDAYLAKLDAKIAEWEKEAGR